MKAIKIVINNPHNKATVFRLFEDVNKPNMPVNVYIQTQTGWQEIEYKTLFAEIMMNPIIVNVQKSTNNRQLNFYNVTMWGMMPCMEPSLTIDKKPREKKKLPKNFFTDDKNLILCAEDIMPYKKEWNPKKWNIADTGEYFLLTHNTVCVEATILPAQKFELYFEVNQRKKIISPSPFNNVLIHLANEKGARS